MPWDCGCARLELARALAPSEPALAVAEARRALDCFRRLGAPRCADEAAELIRSLGGRAPAGGHGDGALKRRERDVLALLARGRRTERSPARS